MLCRYRISLNSRLHQCKAHYKLGARRRYEHIASHRLGFVAGPVWDIQQCYNNIFIDGDTGRVRARYHDVLTCLRMLLLWVIRIWVLWAVITYECGA